MLPGAEEMKDYYIPDGQNQHIQVTMEEYFRWHRSLPEATKTRIGTKVARSMIGDITVSTAFLGTDHGFGGGPPLLYETMIFGGERDEETTRYTTWGNAVTGHEKIASEISRQRQKQAEKADLTMTVKLEARQLAELLAKIAELADRFEALEKQVKNDRPRNPAA